MNIIQLPLGEVHPYKNNPRKNDGAVDAVAESIRQYGFLVPLVISADHETVSYTHLRWPYDGIQPYRQPPQQTGRGGVLPQKAPGEAVRPRCREGLPEILRQTRASRGGGSHAGQASAARRSCSSSGRGQAEQRSDEFRGVALSGRAYQDPAPRSAREVVQMNISSKGAALLMEMG